MQVVRRIREHLGPFARAILFAGAARTALAGGAPLTLTSERAAEAVDILGRPTTVALHFEGWAHFSEGADELRTAFESEGCPAACASRSPASYCDSNVTAADDSWAYLPRNLNYGAETSFQPPYGRYCWESRVAGLALWRRCSSRRARGRIDCPS